MSAAERAYPLVLEVNHTDRWRQLLRLTTVLAMIGALLFVAPSSIEPAHAARVSGAIAEYDFSEGSGTAIANTGSAGSALDLTITTPDTVSWIPGGGISVSGEAGIESASAASAISSAVQGSGEITVEAWVTPAQSTIDGTYLPHRIVTMEGSHTTTNFTLGQGGSTYVARFRTTITGEAGLPSLDAGTPATSLQHVVYTREGTTATMYVDGTDVGSTTIDGSTSNWDDTYLLRLANAAEGSRTFLGDICLVAVYGTALSATQVAGNYAEGCGGVVPDDPPAAPTGLSASGSDGVVDLAWAANSEPDLDGYNVYRSTTAPVSVNGTNKINASLVGTNSYSDTNVSNGTTYHYVVTAVDTAVQESAASNEDSATPSAGSTSNFAAYNDLGWATGQLEGNITKFTSPNGGSGLPTSGDLIDFTSGADTGVDLTVTGGDYNGTSHAIQDPAGQSGEPVSGTDAYDVFNGYLSPLGTISYEAVAPPAGNLVLTFDSMDPGHAYEIVFYGHRDKYTPDERASLVTITGATEFTNESTPGSDFSGTSDDSTRLAPDNDDGYVARWTGVRPGSDGTVELVVSYDGNPSAGDEYQGKYANALALFDEGVAPPDPGATLTFAAIGDFGDGSADEGSVAALVDAKNVDLIVTAGDNSYGSNPIDVNIGQFYSDYIGDYTGAYGSGATTNAFFPSPGNHDYTDGGGIAAALSYFTLPGAGVASTNTSGSELFYDVIAGPVHFFAIDSNVGQPGVDLDAQKAWLQARLAASTSTWKVVCFHHVAYSSSSSHGSSVYMQWPFEQWGADVVIGGHDHVYERILRDDNSDGTDMLYLTSGWSGRSLYGFGTPIEGSVVRYNADYGAVIGYADNDGLTFEAWSIAGGGTMIDTYTMGAPVDPPDPTEEWVAYNDMNTSAGATNPANVTSHTYEVTGGVLKDFATGTALPVTVSGTTIGGYDPHPNGGPVTNASSDAYAAFNGIVDLSGMDELDANTWQSILTFDNLDPAKTYEITLSGNRAEPTYEGNRWTRVTIGGAIDLDECIVGRDG